MEQPLHLQVETSIRRLIEQGEYAPGERIPSERELADELGISRMTIRRALDDLVRADLLERRSTSGTYVREARVLRDVGVGSTLGLTQLLARDGTRAGSRLLSFSTEEASRQVAVQLALQSGDRVVRVCRLRFADLEPFCVETSYLPLGRVPGLAADDLAGQTSLYGLLDARYGIVIGSSDEVLSVARATEDDADALGLEPGDPVLLLRATTFDSVGRPIEYLHSVNHPERVAFRTTTARP